MWQEIDTYQIPGSNDKLIISLDSNLWPKAGEKKKRKEWQIPS